MENTVLTLYQDLIDEETPFKVNIVTPNSAERLEDGLFIFHNPNASNPLDLDFLMLLELLKYMLIKIDK